MIGLCVGLHLLNLAEVSDVDFWIAGSRASNGLKMTSSQRWEPWRLEAFINQTDALQIDGSFEHMEPQMYFSVDKKPQ
jgi:hypothetical protein